MCLHYIAESHTKQIETQNQNLERCPAEVSHVDDTIQVLLDVDHMILTGRSVKEAVVRNRFRRTVPLVRVQTQYRLPALSFHVES